MQGLVLLLVGLMGLQDLPLQSVVHTIRQATAHHECSHPKGVCPMNPDGPCRCNHDADAISTDGPALSACDGQQSTTATVLAAPKILPDPVAPLPRPRVESVTRNRARMSLSPQRTGDEVFHPPRKLADVRPSLTLRAPISA